MSKTSRANKSTFPGRYLGSLLLRFTSRWLVLWVALAEVRPKPSGEPSNNEFLKWRSCLFGIDRSG